VFWTSHLELGRIVDGQGALAESPALGSIHRLMDSHLSAPPSVPRSLPPIPSLSSLPVVSPSPKSRRQAILWVCRLRVRTMVMDKGCLTGRLMFGSALSSDSEGDGPTTRAHRAGGRTGAILIRGPPAAWPQGLGEVFWGTWNCRKGLSTSDVAGTVIQWASTRSLHAVLLSDVGVISSDTLTFLRSDGWNFVYTQPGIAGRAVGIRISPKCAPEGEPARCGSGGLIAQVISLSGSLVRLSAVYQPPSLDSAGVPA